MRRARWNVRGAPLFHMHIQPLDVAPPNKGARGWISVPGKAHEGMPDSLQGLRGPRAHVR
ncbi:hypothetical protein GCM10009608_30300 [Pseudonocardia alaniniphila]